MTKMKMTSATTSGNGGGGGTSNTFHIGGPVQPQSPAVPDFAPIRLYFKEGELTPDSRIIDPNSVNFNRPPPFSIRLQTTQPESGGHAGAKVCGVITNITRDGLAIICDGFLDLTDATAGAGRQAYDLITNGTMQTWSPDMGDATIDVEENYTDEDGNTPHDYVAHFVSCTFLGATLVSMPALASAVVELLDSEGNVLVAAPQRQSVSAEPAGTNPENSKIVQRDTAPSGATSTDTDFKARIFPAETRKKLAKSGVAMPDGSYPIPDVDALRRAIQSIGRTPATKRGAVKAHIKRRASALGRSDLIPKDWSTVTAHGGSYAPPAEFFTNPNLPELQRYITISPEGRVFGHLAGWGECHIGYPGQCVEVPSSESDYAYFRIGQTQTAEGTLVATGPLTLRGGHASRSYSAAKAQAHYDDTDSAWADVAIFEDPFGIVFSGALRPDADDDVVRRAMASGISGDWRDINESLELVAACSVNTPGFPKVRLLASGEEDSCPRVLALVAAGGTPLPSPDLNTLLNEDIAELASELRTLRQIVASAGLEAIAFEALAKRLET